MTLLLFLRISCDLAFYYAFAGVFVTISGAGGFFLPGILLPALFSALSRLAGDRRALRLILLLPACVCLLLPSIGIGNRIAYLPALAYAAYLAAQDHISMTDTRQKDVLRHFLQVWPVFFLLGCIFGGFQTLSAFSLPAALLTVVLCVFLTRTLRHGPDIYLNRKFLLRSILSLAAFLCAAWLIRLPVMIHALAATAAFFYQQIIVPVFTAALYLLAAILSPLINLLGSLNSTGEGVTIDMDFSLSDLTDESTQTGGHFLLAAAVLKVLAVSVVVAVVLFILLRLFRHLAGESDRQAGSGHSTQVSRSPAGAPADSPGMKLPASPLHPVNQVRRSYRRYLHLCREKGFTPPAFYTSQAIADETSHFFREEALAEQLRELYIKARYDGCATRDEAAQAKELVEKLKSE